MAKTTKFQWVLSLLSDGFLTYIWAFWWERGDEINRNNVTLQFATLGSLSLSLRWIMTWTKNSFTARWVVRNSFDMLRLLTTTQFSMRPVPLWGCRSLVATMEIHSWKSIRPSLNPHIPAISLLHTAGDNSSIWRCEPCPTEKLGPDPEAD